MNYQFMWNCFFIELENLISNKRLNNFDTYDLEKLVARMKYMENNSSLKEAGYS